MFWGRFKCSTFLLKTGKFKVQAQVSSSSIKFKLKYQVQVQVQMQIMKWELLGSTAMLRSKDEYTAWVSFTTKEVRKPETWFLLSTILKLLPY